MRLILAETGDVRVSKRIASDNLTRFFFRVDVNRPEDNDDNDEVAKTLLAEVRGGEPSFLKAHVRPCKGGDHELIVCGNDTENENEGGSNILQNLRERFHDNVLISLEIRSTPSGEFANEESDNEDNLPRRREDFSVLCLFSKGMVIDPDHDTCHAHSLYITKFNLGALLLSSTFHITAYAQIDDDLIPVQNALRAQKTNMKILRESLASDVIITAGNGAEFRSHKCFLIANSRVFKEMLEGEGEEEGEAHVRIDMPHISKEGVAAFLRFIYYGDVIAHDERISVAFDVLCVAHEFKISNLESIMITFLLGKREEEFRAKMAFKIYKFVRGIAAHSVLKMKVVRAMQMKYAELENLPEFREMFHQEPNEAIEFCKHIVQARPLKRSIGDEEGEGSGSARKRMRRDDHPHHEGVDAGEVD